MSIFTRPLKANGEPKYSNGEVKQNSADDERKVKDDYKFDIKWMNVIIMAYLHLAGIYGFCLEKKRSTLIIGWTYGILSGIGTTVGAHRFFTHKTFKANQKFKMLLVILQTMAGQEPVLKWARDHRVHHKFTDTNADPYNSRRGFFFAHVGWLLCKKHPEVIRQGKKVDMSDLERDPLLKFQQKYYLPFAILFNFILPVYVFWYLGESFHVSWYSNCYRYVLGLNLVWLVNSFAHLWGSKPYDANISPTDTYLVGFLALGEGWHNYHHIFPWDYKTSELPGYVFNLSTMFIDFFAKIGWATDLKTVPESIIKARILRTGDGSHIHSNQKHAEVDSNNNEAEDEPVRDLEHFWGFGDKDLTSEDMQYVEILNRAN